MIFPKHYQEWLESGVNHHLINNNIESLNGESAADYLFYGENLPRRNDGRLSDSILKNYAHIEYGGWWCNTVNPITGEPSLWGCLKPDKPRFIPQTGKKIKYETPPKVATEAFFLEVDLINQWKIIKNADNQIKESWRKKVQEYAHKFLESPVPRLNKLAKGEDIDTIMEEIYQEINEGKYPENPEFFLAKDPDFWPWVKTTKIPLNITEGAKKAGALLTAGYCAIALPGIFNGYRNPKDINGEILGDPFLIKELEHFADGREINLIFDQDEKPKTIRMVRTATINTGKLFQEKGCQVNVVTWEGEEKGIDDLLINRGEEYL